MAKLAYKDRDDVDMTNWDIDDDTGTLCHVVWKTNLYSSSVFATSHYGQPSYQRDIQDVIEWAEDNINDECFFTIEEPDNKTREIVFYFKKAEDALAFKLMWG